MLLDYDPRWSDDPRSNDPDHRDLSRGSRAGSDPRGRGQVDPRDVFMEHVDLPCGLDREHVHSHDHDYTLRGSETRTLTTVGAFRVVPANDLRDKFDQSLDPRHGELWHPREAGLVHTVRLGRDTTVVTLTKEGRDLLESRQRDADAANRQAFHHGIQRPRELKHDAQVYRAYLEEAERLREEGAHIHRIVLENELKAEYQEFLQDRIATARTATDGRIAMPTRCVPGPSSTTCRATIRRTCNSRTSGLSTRSTGVIARSMSRSLRRTTGARMPLRSRVPASVATGQVAGVAAGVVAHLVGLPMSCSDDLRRARQGHRQNRLHGAPSTVSGDCDAALRRLRPSQYATCCGIVHGQKTRKFFVKLVRLAYASMYDCRHNRAHIYHINQGSLYRAIDDAESACDGR